ncbi:competence CoiA family protein [Streptomyces sp. AS58]|uniref:competence protein CoiA family protein n=1 Tax=Streptomyces sp. AS58 TaxID=1519489 RepID=UPI00131E8915|nr:competence CoiA family protein [Streptomyces sp. AS58]
MLKLELASAVRSAGWHAALEVAGGDGAWRADVMASSPDGNRRIAWEAQLSPITDRDILARTGRYAAEGVGVCWVSPGPKEPRWIDVVPAVQVSAPDEREQCWRVVDGLGGFNAAAGMWEFQQQQLGRFVGWVLSGSVTSVRSLPHYTSVQRGAGLDHDYVQRRLWWTSARSERAQSEHDRSRQREAERAASARQEAADRCASRQQQALQRSRKSRHVPALEDEATRRARAQEQRRLEQEQRRLKQERRRLEQEQRRRYEQEAAKRKELSGRALETARAWWQEVPPPQRAGMLAAVAERAWHDEQVRVEIPRHPEAAESFAYGIPVFTTGRMRALYAIVRPCPELAVLSPQLEFQHIMVRDEQEAGQLAEVMPPRVRITHLGLPRRGHS